MDKDSFFDPKTHPFSERQVEFILNSNAKYNLAHGAVRAGKTVAVLFRFLEAVATCKGNKIWILGYSQGTIYRNIISAIFDPNDKQVGIFRNVATWLPASHKLVFLGKEIQCLGAGDEGALGLLQGGTVDLILCDEMTLYPNSVLQMIITRVNPPGSQLFATMNPREPSHKCKELIDLAETKPHLYYQLHFSIEHNPYLEEDYKEVLRDTLSGLFYKRHYLGLWCLAEGAIFDFFDRHIHTVKRPPRSADFWLAGVDYGTSNPFCCLLIGYNSGKTTQTGPMMWVEKEYYWNPAVTNRQKTNAEFRRDLVSFTDGYAIKSWYCDPAAAAFITEMRQEGIHFAKTDNDVLNGIQTMTQLVKEGTLVIDQQCTNLIREIEGYCWDAKKSLKGEDEPIKKDDHAVDALRYVCRSFLGGRTSLRMPDVKQDHSEKNRVDLRHLGFR